jgi:hypothetical protein
MPDWRQLVRQQLAGIELAEPEAAQIAEELASHLEETYQALVCDGLPEQAAVRSAWQQVNDWQQLKSEIEIARKKEPPMNRRVSQFWFPAFLTLLLAMVFLMMIEELGPKPWISAAASHPRMTPIAVVYLAWVVTLPLIGALGAYLATRAGAAPRAVFSSIVFPVLPYFGFFVIGLPIAVILDDHVAHNIMLPGLFLGFGAWVVLPAIALLAGGVPVHYLFSRRGTRPVVTT